MPFFSQFYLKKKIEFDIKHTTKMSAKSNEAFLEELANVESRLTAKIQQLNKLLEDVKASATNTANDVASLMSTVSKLPATPAKPKTSRKTPDPGEANKAKTCHTAPSYIKTVYPAEAKSNGMPTPLIDALNEMTVGGVSIIEYTLNSEECKADIEKGKETDAAVAQHLWTHIKSDNDYKATICNLRNDYNNKILEQSGELEADKAGNSKAVAKPVKNTAGAKKAPEPKKTAAVKPPVRRTLKKTVDSDSERPSDDDDDNEPVEDEVEDDVEDEDEVDADAEELKPIMVTKKAPSKPQRM